MTEDIVERLREYARIPVYNDYPYKGFIEAADEIEKLREQMESGNYLTENDKLILAIERQALEIKERADEIERLQDVLTRIEQWCNAYPTSVFYPIANEDVKRAGEILAENNISIGSLHAQWARHILNGVADIARAALGEAKDE